MIYTGSAPNQQNLPAVDWLMPPVGGGRKGAVAFGAHLGGFYADMALVPLFKNKGIRRKRYSVQMLIAGA